MGDANLVPVDGIVLLADVVLVARDVDAVDALVGIDQPFALVFILVPFSYTELPETVDGEAEAVALAVFPHAVVVFILYVVDENAVAVAIAVGFLSLILDFRRGDGEGLDDIVHEIGGQYVVIDGLRSLGHEMPLGLEDAEPVAVGVVENLARMPSGGFCAVII